MSATQNKYPVLLLHGVFGYGQQQVTSNVVPYFGLWKSDIRVMFENMGVPCAAPSMGPFTSAWNRCCEIYAQLFGGTVDYGKAHSEKYGMKRFGPTYDKPLLPQWGTLDENGDLIKVNIIGHSFGGATGRLLLELLENGSEEERAVTDPDDLSELFKGGHDGWVHSITTLASPHNGATCLEGAVGTGMRQACRAICDVFNILDATPLRKIYNIGLGMYDLTPEQGDFRHAWNDAGIKKYFWEMEDTCAGDLTIDGAHKLNEKIPLKDHVYYFSYRGYRTFRFRGKEIPSPKSFPAINVLGFFMGRQPLSVLPSEDWRQNDMVINTKSGEAPDGEPRVNVPFKADPAIYRPGVWHVFPAAYGKDHMSFLGWTEKKADFEAFYKKIYSDASAVPTVGK